MPTTYNGIGTHYWGRTNVRLRRDACQHCDRIGDLATFDTTLYFVVVFVPVLPLRRKRIIDMCPACKMHCVANLAQWRAAAHAQLVDSLAKITADPDNLDAVKHAIATAIQCDDESAFDHLLDHLGERGVEDLKTSQLLGAGFEQFGRLAEAEAAYERALRLEDDPSTRKCLVFVLLRLSRPQDAWEMLTPLIQQRDSTAREFALLAIEGFQSKGMHAEALNALDAAAEAFPLTRSDRKHQKRRRISEKHRASRKPVRSKALDKLPRPGVAERGYAHLVPRIIAAAVIFAVLATYFGAAWRRGESRKVYLVSGLSYPYDINVAGRSYRMHPDIPKSIEIAEGDILIEPASPEPAFEPFTATIETEFFSRPFVDHTFIINPDRCALLYWEEAIYSKDGDEEGEAPKIFVDQSLVHMTGIDYFFGEFPDVVQVSGNTSVAKHRVGKVTDLSLLSTVHLFLEAESDETKTAYIRRIVALEPDNQDNLLALYYYVPPDQMEEALRELVAVRPPRVAAHRIYQHWMETNQPQYDLAAEYRKLEATSDDCAFKYLLGRILTDRPAAIQLYRQATACDPPQPYAFSALAYDAMAHGHYEEAEPYIRDGLAIGDNASLRQLEFELHIASQRYAEAVKVWTDHITVNTAEAFNEGFAAIVLTRDNDAALQALEKRVESAYPDASNTDGGEREKLWRQLQVLRHYVLQDADGVKEMADGVVDLETRLVAAVTRGDLAIAKQILTDMNPNELPVNQILAIAIAALRGEDRALADQAIGMAASILGDQASDNRIASRLLTADSVGQQAALDLTVDLRLKCCILTILGLRDPDSEDGRQFLALANRLNIDRRFPYLEIKQAIEEHVRAEQASIATE